MRVWGDQPIKTTLERERKKKTKACRSVSAGQPSRLHPPPHYPHPYSPCDHVGSEAEHEGADEGADLPGGSLSSPPLLLQAALANTGNRSRSAGG